LPGRQGALGNQCASRCGKEKPALLLKLCLFTNGAKLFKIYFYTIIKDHASGEVIFMLKQQRRAIIESIAIDSLLKGCTDSEAISMLFWKFSCVEPPLSYEEQLLFMAFYRMYESYNNVKITSCEKALEILGISISKLNMSQTRIVKEAKLSYWRQYNELSRDLKKLLHHACEIGRKKKALSYICGY
jgi:hypothetical protein